MTFAASTTLDKPRAPRTPRTRIVPALAALLAAGATALAGCSRAGEPVDLPQPPDYEQQIFDQINALRIAEGVPRLTHSDCMADHARDRATVLPGAADVPREELPADCGDFDYAGENVARSDQPAHEVVATWADNELQYPNLVDPLFEQAGVGCLGVSAAETTRVVQGDEEQAGMVCSVIFQGFVQ